MLRFRLVEMCVYPPRWSACMSTTVVVVDVCWSGLRSSWHHQRTLVVVDVCSSHVTSHFSVTYVAYVTRLEHRTRCAVVEPIATMRAQNYAGSRIKSGSCLSAPQADCWHAIPISLRYSNIPTAGLNDSRAYRDTD